MEDVISERCLKALRTIGDPLLEERGARGDGNDDSLAGPGAGRRPARVDVGAELEHIERVRKRGVVALAGLKVGRSRTTRRRAATDPRARYIDGLRHHIQRRLEQNGARATGTPQPLIAGRPPASPVTPNADDGKDRARAAREAEDFRTAQRLFGRYGTEISAALLLAALPQTYATRWGPSVLVATGGLVTDLRRRIQGTAEFLLQVMTPPDDEPCSTAPPAAPWEQAALGSVELRVLHHTIRTGLSPKAGPEARRIGLSVPDAGEGQDVPLNQEDLLGTLLTFTVTVFEVLEQFGITWTSQEQHAYLQAWDKVGAFLGIGDEDVKQCVERAIGGKEEVLPVGWTTLRPPTVAAARAMMKTFRERHWVPVPPWTGRDGPGPSAPISSEWESLRPGRLLTAALLDELAAAMSPRTRALPSILVRMLAPPVVRDRLALGGGGMFQALVDGMPRRRIRQDGFTVVTPTSTLGAPALRQTANYVVRKTFLHFLQNGGRFSLPGFSPEWQSDLLVGR